MKSTRADSPPLSRPETGIIVRRRVAAYAGSLAAVGVAVVVRLLLDPLLGDQLPFITLFLAVAFAAWYGGTASGLVALLASAVAADYFILQPRYSLAIGAPENQVGLVLYGAVGVGLIFMLESLRKAGQRAADRSELLRTTLASIGDGVITTDAEGGIASMNAVAEVLTGWSTDAAKAQPLDVVFRVVNGQTREPVANPVTRALREGVVVGLANHAILIRKDGTEFGIDDSAAPIRRDDGEIIGSVLVFRDVTERRELEKQKKEQLAAARLLASIVESSEDAIISESLDGVIETWNAAAQRLFGYTAEQVVGRHISILIPPVRRGEEEEILARIRDGERVESYETVRLRSDGRLMHVSLTLSPIKNEAAQIVGASKIARDISDRRRAEEALQRSERELSDFFENATVGLHWAGPDGTILRVNRAELDMLGYTREEYVGRNIAAFHADPEVIADVLRRLAEGDPLVNYQARLRCKDGSLRYVLINSNVLWENGQFIHTRCFTRDITEYTLAEQALRESEGRFRNLAETVPSIVWTAAPDGTITYANTRWLEYCGLTVEDNSTKWLEFVVHPDDRQRCMEAWTTALREGTEYDIEVRNRRHDGVYRWFVTRAIPSKDEQGRVLAWFGVTSDIHDQKEMQEQLRDTDRRKDEFLATLAHELRNPLAPLRNSLELMKRASGNGEVIEQARSTMDRQMAQMERLVDDLLDVSRITRNKLELKTEPVELASVVHHAVEASRPHIERAGQELNVALPPEPIYLHADPMRLAQVFANLLTNSCKYTEPGGRIWLTAERRGSEVAVKVKDTGVGIPPEMLSKVFDLFTQVDRSLERSEGGLGIGLSLVMRLVELHGGTVTAHSDGPGRGSEFVVRLPVLIQERKAPRPPEPAATPTPTTSRRVLVVDDNRDSADSLAMLMSLTGHDTQTAHDGVAAVEKAAAFRPDVILLDIGLPKMSGYDVCRAIREQPWGKDIVIVALTGWGQEEDRRKSKEAGFDGHMVKPGDHTALMKLLASLSTAQ